MSLVRTVALALLFAAGCGGAAAEPQTDAGPATDSGATCDPSLTYANFGASFLTSHCNSCHGWTHSQVETDGVALSSIVLGGYMPPGGGGLTQEQRQQFADWVACGAP
jgi:hypothetical protein